MDSGWIRVDSGGFGVDSSPFGWIRVDSGGFGWIRCGFESFRVDSAGFGVILVIHDQGVYSAAKSGKVRFLGSLVR